MSLLVTNCFHWVGFHLVNKLLESSYHVEGVDCQSSNNRDHLEMFFGRNSAIKLVTEDDISEYDLSIVVGDCHFINKIKSKVILEINYNKTSKNSDDNHIYITMPLLFGEWMPMNKTGMYDQNEFVSFRSNKFLNEGIYIDDFVQHLLQLIQDITSLDNPLTNKQKKEKKLEKYMEFSDNRPIQTNLKTILEHYEQFKHLY